MQGKERSLLGVRITRPPSVPSPQQATPAGHPIYLFLAVCKFHDMAVCKFHDIAVCKFHDIAVCHNTRRAEHQPK